MAEAPYSNRELDEKFKGIHDKLDSNKSDIMLNINETKVEVKEVRVQTEYTNGKVKKIIIALVLIGGIVIGTSITNFHDLVQLVTKLI